MLCIGYAKSAPDEGSLSAETDPSPARDAAHRVHPLPGLNTHKGRGEKRVYPYKKAPVETGAPFLLSTMKARLTCRCAA